MREPRTPLRWSFTIVVALTVVFLVLPFISGAGGAIPLRDRHSDPVAKAPISAVAVTMAGKLYHDPHCTFIHGPVVLEPTSTASSRGFSPCPRCLGALRAVAADRPGL
jgi:hypothetical protein